MIQPQTKCPGCNAWSAAVYAGRVEHTDGPGETVQPDDEPQGVERLANDHEGTCLTLRSQLLS